MLAHKLQNVDDPWTPERLSIEPVDIAIIHFSGELKLWDRNHLGHESNQDFARRLLQNNSEYSFKLWVDGAGEPSEYEVFGVRRLPDGTFAPLDPSRPPVQYVIELGTSRALAAALQATEQWREDLEALPATFSNLPPLSRLLCKLQTPQWPAFAAYPHGARVEVFWISAGEWYPGTVTAASLDGSLSVTFDQQGFWGSTASGLCRSDLRPLSEDARIQR